MGLVHHLIIATMLKIRQLCAMVYLLMLIFMIFFLFSFFLLTHLVCHQVKTDYIWVNKDCLATTADQLSYYFFQLCFICLHFDTLCVSSVTGPDWPRQEKDEQADVLGALQPVSGGAALLGPQTSSL